MRVDLPDVGETIRHVRLPILKGCELAASRRLPYLQNRDAKSLGGASFVFAITLQPSFQRHNRAQC